MAKAAAAKRSKKGLTVKTYKGLNKKRMESKGGGANQGNRVVLKDGDTIPVQFYGGLDTAEEFYIHQWQEDGKWHNVPCLGEGCPLCEDESESKSKVKYRFCIPVYNLKEKKAQILEGPKDMAQKIAFRFEQKPKKWLARPWEITRYPTNPTTYACDKGEEEDLVAKAKLPTMLDTSEYIMNEAKQFYGDSMPSVSSLDDDDDDVAEDDDAEKWDRDELEKKSVKQLKKIAAEEGVSKKDIAAADDDEDELINLILGEDDDDDDEDDSDDDDDDDSDDDDDDDDSDDDDEDDDDDDEDDDDEDDDDDDDDDDDEDDDDDDDDEEDDEPPAKKSSKKAPVKKPAKKAPAKKAAAKGKKK